MTDTPCILVSSSALSFEKDFWSEIILDGLPQIGTAWNALERVGHSA
jgi:hypothetical protein